MKSITIKTILSEAKVCAGIQSNIEKAFISAASWVFNTANEELAEKDTQLKDLHQQLSSLKASMDILVDDNEMLSKRIKEIEKSKT